MSDVELHISKYLHLEQYPEFSVEWYCEINQNISVYVGWTRAINIEVSLQVQL